MKEKERCQEEENQRQKCEIERIRGGAKGREFKGCNGRLIKEVSGRGVLLER